jgi:hypothetical protein
MAVASSRSAKESSKPWSSASPRSRAAAQQALHDVGDLDEPRLVDRPVERLADQAVERAHVGVGELSVLLAMIASICSGTWAASMIHPSRSISM